MGDKDSIHLVHVPGGDGMGGCSHREAEVGGNQRKGEAEEEQCIVMKGWLIVT